MQSAAQTSTRRHSTFPLTDARGTLARGVVFPTLKARQALALLQRNPLSYQIVRQTGSHRKLESDYPGADPIGFSYHDNKTVPSGVLRKWLLVNAGLTEEEAKELL